MDKDELARDVYGTRYEGLHATQKLEILKLMAIQRITESLDTLAYVSVYEDFPENHPMNSARE